MLNASGRSPSMRASWVPSTSAELVAGESVSLSGIFTTVDRVSDGDERGCVGCFVHFGRNSRYHERTQCDFESEVLAASSPPRQTETLLLGKGTRSLQLAQLLRGEP